MVRDSGLPNMLYARIPVPSQLHYQVWEDMATGHEDDRYVLDGIKYGFPLHYAGPILDRENRESHSSADQFPAHVQNYVDIETSNKAMLGPFDVSPFIQWTNISPIMTRPKAGSAKRRVIVDLSFPRDNNVINFVYKNMIFGRYHEHRLPTVQDTIKQIELMGFQAMLATLDIERA